MKTAIEFRKRFLTNIGPLLCLVDLSSLFDHRQDVCTFVSVFTLRMLTAELCYSSRQFGDSDYFVDPHPARSS